MKKYIPSQNKTYQSGFTLIELLVVLIIIVALLAILAPNILSYRSRANVRQAESQLSLFWRALEDYAAEYGKYPTTEQGLKALIFIPANEITGVQTGLAGMQQGAGMTAGGDPNSMLGGATAVGTGMNMTGTGMMQPGMTDPGMGTAVGTGMQPGMAQPGMMQPGMTAPGMGTAVGTGMDMSGTGMMQPGMNDPGMGMAGAVGTGMTDPMMGGMAQSGMMGTAGSFGLGMSNPNLYTAMRKRSTPFIAGDDVPIDPWKNPYRYDNSITATGVNPFTGEKKPAIWSAGPDGQDNTEDDIRYWKPEIAQAQLMNSQQNSMGMTQPGMTDPMMGGMTDPNMMNPNPMGGMTQPNMMNPNPMGGMTQPNTMNPNPMGGMTQPNMMNPNPMGGMTQPNMMNPNPMGGMTQPNMMNPNPMGGMTQPNMPIVPQQ
ncbi:hypothetical protein FACS189427_00980 [Planctomycetales bacterium]|nr:hypothetical protein FACS189427_00980 [Planctomycetales bacterium]